MVTSSCYVVARRLKATPRIRSRSNRLMAPKESRLKWAAFLSYLLMALRHQANPARWLGSVEIQDSQIRKSVIQAPKGVWHAPIRFDRRPVGEDGAALFR